MSLEYVRNWLRARQRERERRARLLATRPPSRISLRMLLLLLVPLGLAFSYAAQRYRQWRADVPYRLAEDLGPRVHYQERQRYPIQHGYRAEVQGPSVELKSLWTVSCSQQTDIREFNAFAREHPRLVRSVAIFIPFGASFAPAQLKAGLVELRRAADIRSLTFGRNVPLQESAWQALEGEAQMRCLDTTGLKCTPPVARVIGSFRNLEALNLRQATIGNQSLKHLEGLQKLKSLDLSRTNTTDADLAALEKLTSLEELNLGLTKVTDDGVRRLAGLKNLRILILWNTSVGDDGLAALENLPALEFVNLSNTKVTGRSGACLAGWKRLRAVDVGYTDVDSPCVTRLCQLPRLQWLNLESTPITPDCLDDLYACQSLQEVQMGYNEKIGSEAAKAFQRRFQASRAKRRD